MVLADPPAPREISSRAGDPPSTITLLLEVAASEWTKIRSVRSTLWLLLAAAVTAIGGSTIVAFAERSSSEPVSGDPLASIFLAWIQYPVLAFGILGLLNFTNEYGSGQIRTTFAAVPQRLILLFAKISIVGIVTLAAGVAFALISFFLTQVILANRPESIAFTDPGVALRVFAAGFCLFAVALLGLALGAIIRNTAGAVAALPALIYVPLILLALPAPWNNRIGKFTLPMAAYQIVSLHPHAGLLSPALSFLVVVLWPTVALAIAAILLTRRDA